MCAGAYDIGIHFSVGSEHSCKHAFEKARKGKCFHIHVHVCMYVLVSTWPTRDTGYMHIMKRFSQCTTVITA